MSLEQEHANAIRLIAERWLESDAGQERLAKEWQDGFNNGYDSGYYMGLVDSDKSRHYTDGLGVKWRVHPDSQCSGEACVIHNPSEHPMRSWATFLRGDKRGLVERICGHGIGHPDPDSLAYFIRIGDTAMGVHGCDGCCRLVRPSGVHLAEEVPA